ncbi:MAG: AraC family transcriptional regulator [Spirochaetia bacterium]|nr:AraC family transcriptional regulator [Spirochaetia bacterium]
MDTTGKILRAIDYIEDNLTHRLGLEAVADCVGLSMAYLDRTFSMMTGLPLHVYLKRRQLTEAARLLSFSDLPIMDIALSAGYENQQAFSNAFRSRYKYAPGSFRKRQLFYPLQQRWDFSEEIAFLSGKANSVSLEFDNAEMTDISGWLRLAGLAVDGYPCFDEREHISAVEKYIKAGQALLAYKGNILVGALLVSPDRGFIDFLGIHPLCRKTELASLLLSKAVHGLLQGSDTVCMTTYRDGDRSDTGYRKFLLDSGFVPSDLSVEFGYPTQKFLFDRKLHEGCTCPVCRSPGKNV